MVAQVSPDAEGRFRFDDVVAGPYAVGLGLAGYVATPATAVLGIGQTVTVVDLVLEVDERALWTIVGRARLQGAAERAQAGIRVEAVGSRSPTFGSLRCAPAPWTSSQDLGSPLMPGSVPVSGGAVVPRSPEAFVP